MKRVLGIFSVISLLVISGCMMPGAEMLNKVPINSVTVEVLDQEGNPIQGAQVEASNGRQTTTGANGKAKIRFGSLGIHNISVYADNYMPNNMIVTMPTDNGNTVTARLTGEVQMASLNFGINMNVNMYPMMFNYLFTGYGYELEVEDYTEGGWTQWQVSDGEGEVGTIMKKGFLKELENGQQWWQIVMFEKDEEEPVYIAEVLFSEGRQQIVRLREKMGDSEPQEKPVSEGWYSQPQKLTKESIEGAVAETGVSVNVPKGTFTTDLIDFGVAPEISLKLWRVTSEEVPGGVVKSSTMEGEEVISSLELMDFGTDAETMLNSF
ncbi:Ig-like domain-containing protein [Gracilimonas sp.]|uniref:Ig-like domain-containing protein n=1 Tax=Gracilimonas sp. TaxID=1974203 RepID=UPI0032EC63DE